MTTPTAPKVYADRLYRCNINGTTPGEIMVHTVWVQRDALDIVMADLTQQIANKVRDSWAKCVTTAADVNTPALVGKLASTTVYTGVTVYKVDSAGRAVEQREATFDAAVKGNMAVAIAPQLACVVSLGTDTPGRRGKGRLYLGGLSNDFAGSNGRIPATVRDATARQLGQFYRDIRDNPGGGDAFRPVVVSPTTGTASKITKVAVGDVLDTMRSRRNRLVEAKTSVVVDP